MAATGTIAGYRWAEFSHEEPQLRVPDVVRGLSPFVLGLIAVNVSWDSGRLLPSDEEFRADWAFHEGHAITPPIDDLLLRAWPSGDGYDEWYFFKAVPSPLALNAFCNYGATSLKDANKLAFPGGLYLASQLNDARPELVVGEKSEDLRHRAGADGH